MIIPSHNHSSGVVEGKGLVNSIINKLPVELHLPGYNYCGPGTKLAKRLARGDPGINGLDEHCKIHDIAYSREKDLSKRHEADRVLAEGALKRFFSKDATWGEKAAALGVATAMKTKIKLGMGNKQIGTKSKCGGGIKKRKTKVKLGKMLSFKEVTNKVKKRLMKNKSGDISSAIKVALRTADRVKDRIKPTRIITVPKRGGVLPLIPIFAGLSALGALSGGAAGIAKAVNDAKNAGEQLKEAQRHNKTMESIAMGKGLYLRPYKKGMGLFLSPVSKLNKSP